MKNPLSSLLFVFIAGLMFAACIARAELMVGDKAPQLQTGEWVQGEPVPAFDSNHVYIVEFWATWCGPCIGSIPHLNALWEKYKDKGVIVVGQDIWDSDGAVAPFVRKMGTNMTYRVALDDKSHSIDGWMAEQWWPRHVNHHGIPSAFIINRDGVIAWIGHPMGLKEKVLDEIVSGHYNLAKATVDYKKDLETDDQFQDLQGKLFSAIKQKKWDDAQSALKGIDTLLPNMTNAFTTSRLQVLLGQKKFEEARQLVDSTSKRYPKNPEWQNDLAWAIATSDTQDAPCLSLAETMAERSVQLSQATNSDPLDTLARVQFMLGKKTQAIATEEQAVNLVQNENEKSALKKSLASYQEGKLPEVDD